ncbi:hypothetical protein FS764_12545 [Agrobacterium vitis]|nr:hypothetical protein [Agrobacterium vitis]MCE6073243.1 hypothetical protein [Agrobacterium vitis]MCF1467731.1 hypothetical protein [Agrobacterium vitis]MCM2451358.1 hypothetical protein [Agrobacterium vitis]MCM2469239.1 hypothetical protein [Agrobacterium vitis]MUO69358.1 hypothetical protein [Agrobacterium vitis]
MNGYASIARRFSIYLKNIKILQKGTPGRLWRVVPKERITVSRISAAVDVEWPHKGISCQKPG